MSVNTSELVGDLPPIHLSVSDYNVLAELALRMEARDPSLSRTILEELNRADIHDDDELPEAVVRIGSDVTFRDNNTDVQRTVRLVMPADADIEAGKISVMTSVGAGLIGMQVGGKIDWPCPDGRPRSLTILAVSTKTE